MKARSSPRERGGRGKALQTQPPAPAANASPAPPAAAPPPLAPSQTDAEPATAAQARAKRRGAQASGDDAPPGTAPPQRAPTAAGPGEPPAEVPLGALPPSLAAGQMAKLFSTLLLQLPPDAQRHFEAMLAARAVERQKGRPPAAALVLAQQELLPLMQRTFEAQWAVRLRRQQQHGGGGGGGAGGGSRSTGPQSQMFDVSPSISKEKSAPSRPPSAAFGDQAMSASPAEALPAAAAAAAAAPAAPPPAAAAGGGGAEQQTAEQVRKQLLLLRTLRAQMASVQQASLGTAGPPLNTFARCAAAVCLSRSLRWLSRMPPWSHGRVSHERCPSLGAAAAAGVPSARRLSRSAGLLRPAAPPAPQS